MSSSLKETLKYKDIKVPSVTPGWNLDAWQYIPQGGNAPYTVIVMAHGLSGNKTMGLKQYAEFFVKLGYAAVVFDYRRWGDSDGYPRHIVNIEEQLEDYRTIVKYCRQQPTFDPNRIVVWGSSFAGGHAVSLAAERDLNLTAAIGQCSYLGVMPSPKFNWVFVKMTVYALVDLIKLRLGMSPVLIDATAEPGGFGMMNSHDSKSGMAAIIKNVPGAVYPNTLNASTAFATPRYLPKERAKTIECPTLVIQCSADSLCLTSGAEETAAASPYVQLSIIQAGHFDIYPGGKLYEENLKIQKDFLETHVPV